MVLPLLGDADPAGGGVADPALAVLVA